MFVEQSEWLMVNTSCLCETACRFRATTASKSPSSNRTKTPSPSRGRFVSFPSRFWVHAVSKKKSKPKCFCHIFFCLEVRGEIIRHLLFCVVLCTEAVQSKAHLDEQFSGLVLSHWAHFTVNRLIYLCLSVCFVCYCFILHSCRSIVSTLGWTWWDWSLILWTYLSSMLWHCWLGHLTRKTRPRYDP